MQDNNHISRQSAQEMPVSEHISLLRMYWLHAVLGVVVPMPLAGILFLVLTPFQAYLHSDVAFYLPVSLALIIPAVVIYFVERGHGSTWRKVWVFLGTALIVFGIVGGLIYAAASSGF